MAHQVLPEPLSPPPDVPISHRKVLELLKAHLLPHPQLNYLPTALLHIRHFQTLANGIVRECARVVAEQKRLCHVMQGYGMERGDAWEYGALDADEEQKIASFIDARLTDELAAISLEWRSWVSV